GVRTWESDLQEVDEASLEDAADWIGDIDATGSTDINRALLEALAQLDEESNRPAYLLFMTDGLPTQGETDAAQIIENALDARPQSRSVRLFTFGVGYDVNTDLLDTLSREMGGRATYVKPEQDIEEVVGDFYDQIGKPVLANVTLDLGRDAVVSDQFPYPLPDLFAGEQLVAVGRYREGRDVEVTLEGEINGAVQSYVFSDQVLAERGGEPFVARLWATRKIGSLMEQIRRDGPDQELVSAIVDLSLTYGIVSPYTSYLVLEPGMEGTGGALSFDSGATLRESAAGEAAATADMVAAAPASGAEAVERSQDTFAMAEAETVQQTDAVRYVGGKAFVQRGWVAGPDGEPVQLWVDTTWDEVTPTETLEFGSDAYFELVEDPTVAEWLSLSPEMVVVLDDGSVIRVTAAPAE
ncbi:MAG: VWA domain-containing protein, partial [Caldilineaceae bacterium]